MRAALYARFSTDMQSAASIADQLHACRRLAERLGAEVVAEFSDAAISGAAAANRPGLQALLAAAEEKRFDVVLAEAMDRLSRSQADMAAMFEDLRFFGVRIHTEAEGAVEEMYVGLKGTMNALFLRDLAGKVRRGLSGVARSGRSAGGRSYGYRLVRAYDAAGEPVRGLREVDEAEAEVVRRIFREYAAGRSPRAIAGGLNADGVPGPRGGPWNASTINGNAARGNGVLHNALYDGRQVWGRNTWSKDRRTGKRRSRAGAGETVAVDAPELRIVPEALWAQVQARVAALACPQGAQVAGRRPRHLLSGKVRCAACGGPMVVGGPGPRLRCAVHREKGAAVCANGRSVLMEPIQARVLAAIRASLLEPAVIEAAVLELHAEEDRRRAARRKARAGLERELADVAARAGRLVDQVADGLLSGAAVRERLARLEARRAELEQQLQAEPPAPANVSHLNPAAAGQYRKWVEQLQAGLTGADILERAEAQNAFRRLVRAVWLTPAEGRGAYTLDLEMEMAALLRISPEKDGHFVSKVGAGVGFEPTTFRL